MKFDSNFKSVFQNKLVLNLAYLEKSSVDFVVNNFKSYSRIAIENITELNERFELDFDDALTNITKTVKDSKSGQLNNRVDDWPRFVDNEIYFNSFFLPEPIWGSEAFMKKVILRRDFEYICEREFWNSEENNLDYINISNFSCYNDLLIPEELVESYKNKSYNINAVEWDNYIYNLIQENFSDWFSNIFQKGGITYFYKQINEQYGIGFFYNRSVLKKHLKHEIQLPNYLNMFICNVPIENLNIKTESTEFMSLGILGNPFFFHPCFPLISFRSIDAFYIKGKNNHTEVIHKREFEKVEGDLYLVKHPYQHGENIKRHAYFYLKLLKLTSISYLDFIEQTLRDSIKS